MPREFKLIRDYYDNGNLYKKSKVTIEDGLTVLVGCNGTGKTTFLKQIEQQLKKDNIPVLFFNNLTDGGSQARSAAGYRGDYEFLAASMCSSEGENIVLNISELARKIGRFVYSGGRDTGDRMDAIARVFREAGGKSGDNSSQPSSELWILMDAVDSGLSVDNVIDLKTDLFKTILDDAAGRGITVNIVVSANEYELARGERCFDVYAGKYVIFADYEGYRDFIIKSRENKNKRYKK